MGIYKAIRIRGFLDHRCSGTKHSFLLKEKSDKLQQYAERVWRITSGATETRLGDYGIGCESLETIIAQLEQHGMTSLGEHDSVTLEQSRTLPESSP